jgi:hypothetical protein
MLMGFQSREDQQLSSALSADQWMYSIMSSIASDTTIAAHEASLQHASSLV